jgi:hypothetical protein
MMPVTIDPTEVRPPTEPARRRPGRLVLLALPVGLSLAGLTGICVLATWPTEKPNLPPAPVRAAAVNIADWPEIKDGVPEVVSTSAPDPAQARASIVSRAIADARPSLAPVAPAAPIALENSRTFVPVEGTAGPLSPAPFEPAAAPVQASSTLPASVPSSETPPVATAVQAASQPVAVEAELVPAPEPIPLQPLVPSAPPQEGQVSASPPDTSVGAEAALPAPSGLRGAVPAAQPDGSGDNSALPSRAAAAKKAKSEARQERAQASQRDAASSSKPASKKTEKVAVTGAKKPEQAKVSGAGAQAGAAGAVAGASPTGEGAQPAAEEDRVRVFGMTLPGFVPTGRKIKETVGNLGDAVMSLPGKL